MKKAALVFFSIALFVLASNAQDRGPVAISPASDSRIARVGDSCPTFSWTSMEWATGYKVVVFETNGPNVLDYKEMEAISSPVLSREIQGRALTWTPSSDERLSNGGMYVWYVQAADAYGTGMWSEGRMFTVEAEVQLVGMEEAVRESLREKGVSEEVIEDALEDLRLGMKEVVVLGVDTEGSDVKTQDLVGIQGTEGTFNTFYGLNAGFSLTTGLYNSFFGRGAGYSTTTANFNIFMGEAAGYNSSTGHSNIFIGYCAGYSNTTGYENTMIGYSAGYSNTTGQYCTFIGSYAGGCTTSGYFNTFIGSSAGRLNTTGQYNTFMGYNAGRFNTTGSSNTFIGYLSGESNTTGHENTFIGDQTGIFNTTGNYNTFMGFLAGYSNTIGYANTFLGHFTGRQNTTGNNNTFIGDLAGRFNTTGYANTFLGRSAGYSNTTGNNNTFMGYYAGLSNTTGFGNVFLGSQAGYNETGSNRLYIDNSSTSSPLIWGDFYNDILAINGKLCIGTTSSPYAMELETTGENAAFVAQRTDGATNFINATGGFGNFGTVTNHPLRLAVNSLWRMRLDSDNSLTMANGATCTAGGTWQNSSSREYKENIHDLTTEEAMDTLEGLVPVKYNYKVDKEEKHVGFIAEDVPELVASKDRKAISPMDVMAVLTKVVQEQQKTISELQKQIDELKNGEK